MDRGGHVFTVDLLERYATKGRGVITCMSAGNDVIVLGTSKGWLIRHDFGGGDSFELDISASSRTGKLPVHRVFVDPGGCHFICVVLSNGEAETYYIHAKWSKPHILNKLKASTREFILGTDNGQLYEIVVDEKDKKEKYIKFLFELTELPEAFKDLQMETTTIGNATRYYVMAVTPTRLYSFTGIGALDVVNRISEQIIELKFDHASDSVSRRIIGLCSDAIAGLFYAYDQNSIFQVSVQDEGRDMWQVYLDMSDNAAALAHCRYAFQRDQVYLVQVKSLKHLVLDNKVFSRMEPHMNRENQDLVRGDLLIKDALTIKANWSCALFIDLGSSSVYTFFRLNSSF